MVTGIDTLTGLPEYRNGGLLLDSGVLRLRDPQWAEKDWAPGDELVVEWRGLTVALLDEIAGIGPARKRALLQHFGTAKAVSRAALSDLRKVDGISEAMARLVYDHFNGG